MIDNSDITQLLDSYSIKETARSVFDMDYSLATEDWVTDKLGPAMLNFLKKNNLDYREEQWECNKYAKTASMLADWAHYKSSNNNTALAFGLFSYSSGDIGHMLNFAIHRNDDQKLYLAFYEPQPQLKGFFTRCLYPTSLSSLEISSCSSCVLV